MFKNKMYEQLDKSASLEEVIEFVNRLSELMHHRKLESMGIDPHEHRHPYDLSRNERRKIY